MTYPPLCGSPARDQGCTGTAGWCQSRRMTTGSTPTQEECMSAAIREYVRSWWEQHTTVQREEDE